MEYDQYISGMYDETSPMNAKEVDDLDEPTYKMIHDENKFLKAVILSLRLRMQEITLLVDDYEKNCENGFLTILKNKLK